MNKRNEMRLFFVNSQIIYLKNEINQRFYYIFKSYQLLIDKTRKQKYMH